MFYVVELDIHNIGDEYENPKFYIKENELKTFMDQCFRSGFQVIVSSISESEFNNAIAEF
jgi:hypothetical protein